jgi:hypothetical protein
MNRVTAVVFRIAGDCSGGLSGFFCGHHLTADAGQVDPFVVHSRERALARFEDLLRLVDLIEDLKAKRCKGN